MIPYAFISVICSSVSLSIRKYTEAICYSLHPACGRKANRGHIYFEISLSGLHMYMMYAGFISVF